MTPAKVRPPIPAIALPEDRAAAALGMGATFFRENVASDLACIRVKGKVLWPTCELERWARENAEPVLPAGGRDA